MLRRPEALNTAKAEPTGDNGVGDFIASVSLSYHSLHLTALALPAYSSYLLYWDLSMSVGISFLLYFHLATDCGCSTVCGIRASLLPLERVEALSFGKLVFGDYNEVILRSTQEETRDTLLDGAN